MYNSRDSNPLNLKIGGYVSILEPHLEDRNFKVKDIIRVTRRPVEQQITQRLEFPFTDYLIQEDEEAIRLRAMPNGSNMSLMALSLAEEFPFNQGLRDAVDDTTGILEYNHDGVTDVFNRLADAKTPWDAVALDSTGKQTKFLYWDWFRNIGKSDTEYLFVEEDSDDHKQSLWRGRVITGINVFQTA